MLLQAMQQFTGMNIIMYYAPRIFKMAGFTTTEQQMIATPVVGLTLCLPPLLRCSQWIKRAASQR